ncbi:hypothetical protein [Flavobacterium psychrophilum]|uniref:Uncharacterized protein n=1 Tax=Flavobacterium psychrophilum TaxID=96345 RepID=A0A7U2NE84_FLAPS|nr:hypothetical protein [Flavobacterium psychrophilum]QRE03521.1 hypothetical protein H0H26_11615 [Flavobacterium psychrophilum]
MGNSSNAYATVKPIETNMSDLITKQDELALRRRAERREIAKDEAEVDKVKETKAKELAKYTSKLNPYDTGSTTYNTTVATALTEAKGKLMEQWQIANDKSKTELEKSTAWANIEDINNYPDYLKNISDRITETNKTYTDQLKKGEIFRNEEWEKKFQNGFAGMTVKMNDKFRPDTLFIDKDGDGKQDAEVSDILKYDQVTQLVPEGISMPKVDLGSLAYKIGKDLGKTTTKDVNGYETTNIVEVTNETARAGIQPLMTDQNVRSYLRLKGEDYQQELTPNLLKTVEDDLVKTALSNTDKTNEKGYNYADQNTDNTLAFNKKKHADDLAFKKEKEANDIADKKVKNKIASAKASGKNTSEPISVGSISQTSISKGKFANAPSGSLGYSIPDGGIFFTPSKDVDEVITNIIVHPDGKHMTFTGTKYTLKEDKTKAETPINVNTNISSEEVGKYMKIIKNEDGEDFKNPGELADFLYRKRVTAKGQNIDTRKEISRSEISVKAKAAGYTTKEYEALLVKNGVSIK